MSEEDKSKLLWWVIGALLGSVGLNQGINKTFTDVRSDPYTGAQGIKIASEVKSMEHRLDNIFAIQQTMTFRMNLRELEAGKCKETVEKHLRNHP